MRCAARRARSSRRLFSLTVINFFGTGFYVLVGFALAGPIAAGLGLERALLLAGIGEFASIMFMLSRSSVRRLRAV